MTLDLEPITEPTPKLDLEPVSGASSNLDLEPITSASSKSSTPATDQALAETPVAAPTSPATSLLDQSGTNYRPEDSLNPNSKAAQVVTGAVQGIGEMIPKSVGQAAKMLFYTPVEETPHALKEAYDVIRGVPVEQAVPESQTYKGFTEKPLAEQSKIITGQVVPLAIGVAGLRGALRPGGELNAVKNSETTQVHGNVFDTGRPEESAGQMPADVSSQGVQTRGQGQVVDIPTQETDVVPEGAGETVSSTTTPPAPSIQGAPSEIVTTEIPKEQVGASAKSFEQVYGPEEIAAGEGRSPETMFQQAQERLRTGKADPYGTAARARTGAITPDEFADLVVEHDRLVNEAAAREGTPEYESAYQHAKDFASRVLRPAETKVSDTMRAMQIKAPIDYTRLTGFRRALNERIGREMTPDEAPAFQKMANDVSQARNEAMSVGSKTAERVRQRFSKVKDISFEDATKQIHDSIMDAVRDCNL